MIWLCYGRSKSKRALKERLGRKGLKVIKTREFRFHIYKGHFKFFLYNVSVYDKITHKCLNLVLVLIDNYYKKNEQ